MFFAFFYYSNIIHLFQFHTFYLLFYFLKFNLQLEYTICKLYKDPQSSHSKAFKEREVDKTLTLKLKNEVHTLKIPTRRVGLLGRNKCDGS